MPPEKVSWFFCYYGWFIVIAGHFKRNSQRDANCAIATARVRMIAEKIRLGLLVHKGLFLRLRLCRTVHMLDQAEAEAVN